MTFTDAYPQFWGVSRMLQLAKVNDAAFNPINVGLLGADGIVLDPDAVAHLIKQTAWL